jgi:hypothetical protein
MPATASTECARTKKVYKRYDVGFLGTVPVVLGHFIHPLQTETADLDTLFHARRPASRRDIVWVSC